MPERFSWVLPQQLAVGSFPRRDTSTFMLRREGITAVLSLTEETERPIPTEIQHSFVWQRVPIPDGFTGGVPTEAQFDRALQILNRWRRKGHVVYVHCLAGVGRSASVCSLYVAQTQNLALMDAIAHVQQQHQYAAPDVNQVQVMQKFLASLTPD
ncbi:phosphatase [Synechococcales cyanobacterium C]|uniref:Phosphatase n=1 Tax=Petrachloros mirabilis ULC683 TaxID=2781853 RepID=A0A8K1ZZC1_9CYAN|nr:dual specificity protein phosphatase [Petrachloros mirabilis]NCJ07934.1 phosphatase [Petrachloros mirabilis ULC683]